MIDVTGQREKMVEKQLRSRGIDNPRVLKAMAEVPREKFIPKDLVEFAYKDTPLPIDENQTISQPYVVALAAELLTIEEDDRILDVGTGSGYAAAVLSKIGAEVYTIERHKSLAETAQKRLDLLGYDNVFVLHGDGTKGWPEHAPFDAINVAAGGQEIPEELEEQLAEGGRLIIPVGTEARNQRLVLATKRDGKINKKYLGRVQFVPLIRNSSREKSEHAEKTPVKTKTIKDRINEAAEPFNKVESADFSALLSRMGDAKIVLIGEATHGTSEFYRMREQITRELIKNKGFNVLTMEADWPDVAHIDRYVRNTNISVPEDVPFTRFPTWMWNNGEVLRFVKWLKSYNDNLSDSADKTGVYGLDLYSMYTSVKAIIDYLEDVDSRLAEIARTRYGCLSPYEGNPSSYGAAAMSNNYKACEADVIDMLHELLVNRLDLEKQEDGSRYFDAFQNARLIANAEEYYRNMYLGAQSSWNLRDSHMFETLRSIMNHGEHDNPKAIVWAHNSHVGNAAATEMGAKGEHNIGQLVKDEYGDDAYTIGFGTDHGEVAAAQNWGGKMRIMNVRPSVKDSVENLMHQAQHTNFILPLHKKGQEQLTKEMEESRLERAIGVIYRPETEIQSHYFQASLSKQFDEYIWFDETSAINPLPQKQEDEKVMETYPFGL